MCDLAKGLFGKTGSVCQPLFLCTEGFSRSICGEFTCMIAMDAECELMLKRPAERGFCCGEWRGNVGGHRQHGLVDGGLRQQGREQAEIVGDDDLRHDFGGDGHRLSKYAPPCVNILLQPLHAQGRLARKSVSDIEAVCNEIFPQSGACLGVRIPCPRRASRASARTAPIMCGRDRSKSEAVRSYSGTHLTGFSEFQEGRTCSMGS